MAWPGDAIPRERLGQCVLQGRRFEAELAPRLVDDVTGAAPWVGPIGAGSVGHLLKGNRMDSSGHAEGTSDALDQVAEALALECDVVSLMRRRLAEVARKRARKANVLDPGDPGLPLVGLGGHKHRSAVDDALDVSGDAKRVVGGSKDRRRADDGPGKIALPRQHRFAPALAFAVLERFGWLAHKRLEVFLARGLAVQVGVHARRDEDVPLALEVARDSLDLRRLVARQVEEDVGLGLLERAY